MAAPGTSACQRKPSDQVMLHFVTWSVDAVTWASRRGMNTLYTVVPSFGE